jgi:hypothetical protein
VWSLALILEKPDSAVATMDEFDLRRGAEFPCFKFLVATNI